MHFASGEFMSTDAPRGARRVRRLAPGQPEQLVIVEGYTDVVGPRAANLALAQRRARWVMDYLVAQGRTRGADHRGIPRRDRPRSAPTGAPACQGRNRRVHFLVRDTEPVQVTASPSR